LIADDGSTAMFDAWERPMKLDDGTSAQRVGWFRRGYDSGKITNCDTFGAGGTL
jgi:uncharacterized protein